MKWTTIEYIRVSRQTGIHLVADGDWEKEHIEGVVQHLELQLKLGAYDEPTPEPEEPPVGG